MKVLTIVLNAVDVTVVPGMCQMEHIDFVSHTLPRAVETTKDVCT